jgi:RNA polymerase sigma-70 factor (ECF subfamily)
MLQWNKEGFHAEMIMEINIITMSSPYTQHTTVCASLSSNNSCICSFKEITKKSAYEKNTEDITNAYNLYSHTLLMYCSHRVSSYDIAVDITQETYVRAWKYLQNNNVILHFKSFLYTTVRNLIVDEYRKRKTVSLMTDDQDLLEAETISNYQNHFLRLLDARHASSGINKLSPIYRKVLTQRYVEDLSVLQISRNLHISQNAVSVRIYRGVKALRLLLDPL